jgi:ubiquinone/menaquinone biosynthesis C-methylase UbiE
MAPLDAQQSSNAAPLTSQAGEIPRLFHFDLPHLQQTRQVFPELTDVSNITNVLDIASGAGEWAINVALASPQLHIVGIENDPRLVEQARAQAEAQGVKNVTFQVMEPFAQLALDADSFDLVNARYLVGLLPVEAWSQALQEFVRVTRPGGILRLTETDLPIANTPAFAQWSNLLSQAFFHSGHSFSPEGRLLSITPMLKPLLRQAGCQQVQQVAATCNFSAGWPAHEEVARHLARTYQFIQPFLVKSTGKSPQEIEQLYQQTCAEMQSAKFCATAFSLTVYSRKA